MSTPFRALFFCVLCALAPSGFAQPAQTAQPEAAQLPADAVLAEVRFEGVSSPQIESLLRVNLTSRPGVQVGDIDLPAERNRILNLGAYSQVSVSIESRPVGPVMFVRVQENPPIREVVLRGAQSVRLPPVRQVLADENSVEAGLIYNSVRAEEAVVTLQTIYRQVGFPGAVPVTLEVRPVAPRGQNANQNAAQNPAQTDTPEVSAEAETPTSASTDQATPVDLENAAAVRLIYTINEAPPIDEVTFAGETVVPESELEPLFRPVLASDTFDLRAYVAALEGVADLYEERGFRGSGVATAETNLADGTLQVTLNELQILSIDTTAIGIDPGQFSLAPGDLYNYNTLLEDVARLARGRSEDIRLEAVPLGSGVQVVFESGVPNSAGPIRRVDIQGNTVFTDAELRLQLELAAGETFTSAQAAEDFRRLLEFYNSEGYELVASPEFNFRDGTYSQRLREVKIAGYQIDLGTQDPRTQESVITRYLPDVGEVYNQAEMERGILQLNQLQILRLGQIGERISHTLIPTDNPAQQLVRFIAQEQPGRTITPSAELTTEGGVSFGADVAVSDNNLFGAAHSASASVNAGTSDIGFLLGGRVAYTVPWLYVDFLDFQEVPTNVSAEFFSETSSNQPLSDDGDRCVPLGSVPDTVPDDEETSDTNSCEAPERVLIGEYTQRDTGFRFSVGRPVIPNLSANVSARFTQSDYFVEPSAEECDPADLNETCSLPFNEAARFVPQSGFSSFLGSSLAFDTRDNPEFAREGYRFSVSGGVGFGNDFSTPEGVQRGYTYEQLEVGARTYIAPFENQSHVFAFRANAGHQFGDADSYPNSRLFVVGNTNNEATQLRGYRREDINPSQTYAAATAEYRYDFGLSTAVTQTIVGIGFVDMGYAALGGESSLNYEYGNVFDSLLLSTGVAVQLNIGFGGGLALPPLRFDYGISPTNPTGVFGFRLGFNF